MKKPNPHQPKLAFDWFSQCSNDEDKEARLQSILAARNALEILNGLCKRRKEKLERPTRETYDSVAWQYLLAHDNGRLEELNYILALLDPLFDKD